MRVRFSGVEEGGREGGREGGEVLYRHYAGVVEDGEPEPSSGITMRVVYLCE